MKQKTGKFLSLLLSLALLCGLCVPSAFAAENRYSDTQGHWAEAAIERWSGYGVIQGYGDTFRPDASITRAQMAAILSNTLGLTETAGNPFSDVAEDAWYAPYVLRCYAAGVMAGDNGRANPDAAITRQQAMVMLGRALGIAPEKRPDLSAFVDGNEVGAWAAPYVAAMVESGIVGGVGNGRLAPGGTMTRAALVTVLDRAVVQYIQAPGSYELENEDGIILVAAGKVTLSGKTSADILVTPAADGKALTFDKATVKGNITVQADDAKITVKDSKLPDITLTGEGSKVTENKPATGSTSSGGSHGGGGGGGTPTYSNLTIAESKTVSSGTYQNVTITADVGDGDVTLSGLTVRGDLYIYGGGSESIKLENCTILGKIIMAKAGGEPPRLYLTNTPVTRVETQKPAIIEAADAVSAVKAVEAKADVEVRGENTTVTTVTVPAAVESKVEVNVSAGTVSKVEAKGETVVSGAADAVDSVVAEAAVTVDSAAVAKVEVPASAENVTVNVQGNSTIEVQTDSASTKIAADNTGNVTVSGTAKDNVTTHTHSWGEGEVTKQPTCMEEGVKTYTCTDTACPVGTKTEAIAKAEHTPVADEAVAADCLTPGKTAGSHCSVCGTVIQAQEDVPALGHDFTGAYVSDETGHWHTCTRCRATDEKTAHTYDTTNCAEAAACTVCGYAKAAGEHIWNEGEVTREATCTEAGEKTYTCTVCNASRTEAIPATGHAEVTDAAVAPTCTETGLTEGKHCSVCNAVIVAQETVAAKGHTWDEGVVTKEPTEETEGVKTFTCTVCGETKTETIPATGNKVTDVFTGIHLEFNQYGLHLVVTKIDEAKQAFIKQIDVDYTCNNVERSFAWSPATVSSGFIRNYDDLVSGENKITMDFVSVPTDEAAAAGYTAGTSSFTATIAYQEESSNFDTSNIQAVFGNAVDGSGTVIEGKKKLTITGLKTNQHYFAIVQDSEDKRTNIREFTTDETGTGISEWYTTYAFSKCTLAEWDVTNVTNNSANIVCRDYAGTFEFAAE